MSENSNDKPEKLWLHAEMMANRRGSKTDLAQIQAEVANFTEGIKAKAAGFSTLADQFKAKTAGFQSFAEGIKANTAKFTSIAEQLELDRQRMVQAIGPSLDVQRLCEQFGPSVTQHILHPEPMGFRIFEGATLPNLGFGEIQMPPVTSRPSRRRKSRRRPARKKAAKPVIKATPPPEVEATPEPVSISVAAATHATCTIVPTRKTALMTLSSAWHAMTSARGTTVVVALSGAAGTIAMALAGVLHQDSPVTWVLAGWAALLLVAFRDNAKALRHEGLSEAGAWRRSWRDFFRRHDPKK